jgi:antitoxin (DNA-binding transcriptional repressor) of toxin-antitoxin stability system
MRARRRGKRLETAAFPIYILAIIVRKMARMPTYSVSEAKDNLSKLIDQAAAGQDVIITKHGKEAARLSAPPAEVAALRLAKRREWAEKLKDIRASLPRSDKTAVEWVREIRDEEP